MKKSEENGIIIIVDLIKNYLINAAKKLYLTTKAKGADHMGAYSIPSNKPFKTKNKLNKSKEINRIKEGLSLIQSGKTVIDINNNSIVIIKDDRK